MGKTYRNNDKEEYSKLKSAKKENKIKKKQKKMRELQEDEDTINS